MVPDPAACKAIKNESGCICRRRSMSRPLPVSRFQAVILKAHIPKQNVIILCDSVCKDQRYLCSLSVIYSMVFG